MNFEDKLITGQLIKRYKRFFVDIKVGSKIVTAHCPNTGSMLGLLKKNNRVWLTKSDNPKRKLKYTLQIIENNNSKVGINTHATNKITLNALKSSIIDKFKNRSEEHTSDRGSDACSSDLLLKLSIIELFRAFKVSLFVA